MLFADVFGSFKCRKRLQLLNFVARFTGSEVGNNFGVPLLHRVVTTDRPRMQWMCTVFMLVYPPSQLTYEAVRTRDAGYEDKPPIQTANHSVSVDLGVVTRH